MRAPRDRGESHARRWGRALPRIAAGFGRGVVGGVRWPEHRIAAVQRRTVLVLVACQAAGTVGSTLGIATAALLAEQVGGSESLAGLMQTFQVLGAALASWVLAQLMGVRGRRPGLVAGFAAGALGALLCVVGGAVSSFPVLLLGAALLGTTTAANNLARYAATDLAPPSRRARSMAVVVWAATVGAVLGPTLAGWSGRGAAGLGLPSLTGPFLLSSFSILLAALVVAVWLRPDPLLVAREAALVTAPGAGGHGWRAGSVASARGRGVVAWWRRVRGVLEAQPVVGAAVAALALAHAVMIAVMVMTPLHMHHGGAQIRVIGLVVSLHVVGMFAFAPLVGWAADRWGRPPVLGAGALVLLVAVTLAGSSPMGASWQITSGLFLLGLGWSLATVSASTLLTDHAPLEVRTDVQGAADLAMGVTAAAAGALGGLVVGGLGFGWLGGFAAVIASGVATAAEFARRLSVRTGASGRSSGGPVGPGDAEVPAL